MRRLLILALLGSAAYGAWPAGTLTVANMRTLPLRHTPMVAGEVAETPLTTYTNTTTVAGVTTHLDLFNLVTFPVGSLLCYNGLSPHTADWYTAVVASSSAGSVDLATPVEVVMVDHRLNGTGQGAMQSCYENGQHLYANGLLSVGRYSWVELNGRGYTGTGGKPNLNGGVHVVLGDSWVTQGFLVNELKTRYPSASAIYNAGVNANKSDQMIARFATDVAAHNPDVVWVLDGTNDAAAGYSVATWSANIQTLRDMILAIGAYPIFFSPAVGSNPVVPIATLDAYEAALLGMEHEPGPPATSTDKTVGIDYTDIQTAFDQAPCGSRILIPPTVYTVNNGAVFRQDCSLQKMTVTTTLYDWLPVPGQRITPSYLYGAGGPLLPVIQSQGASNATSMWSDVDATDHPPNNWTFQGLAWQSALPGTSVSTLCPKGKMFNTIVTVGTTGTSAVEQPQDVVFDQVIIRGGLGRSSTTVCTVAGLGFGVRGGTISNSFIHDISDESQDSFGIGTNYGGSNINLINNYVNAATETGLITSGGPNKGYPDPQYNNWFITHNYWVKSYKWWGGDLACGQSCAHQLNPHGPVVAGGTDQDWITGFGVELNSTMKNLIEFKSVNGAVVKYNVGEFSPGHYLGQWFGICATPRSSGSNFIPGAKDRSGVALSLTVNGTNFSWTGQSTVFNGTSGGNTNDCVDTAFTPGIPWPMRVGEAVCRRYRTPGATTSCDYMYECQKIVTVNNTTQTGTVAHPFNAAETTQWWATIQDNAFWKDVTFTDNVFKNVVTPWQYLGSSLTDQDATALGAGRVRNYTVRNNLTMNSIFFHTDVYGQTLTLDDHGDGVTGPDQFTTIIGHLFDHNTEYRSGQASNAAFGGTTPTTVPSMIPKASGLRYTNNIMGDSVWGISGSGLFGTAMSATLNKLFTPDYVVANNQLHSNSGSNAQTGCLGTCSGNITVPPNTGANYVKASVGDFRVKPNSLWWKAGTDGRDLGVDYDELPLIRNVRIDAGAFDATIEFDLAKNNASIPAALEVTSTTDTFGGAIAYPCLTSTLCPYVVVPSLDPTLFKQPDSSERVNPKLPPVAHVGLHRSWPIGWQQTIVDDRSGASRSMALTPNTTYQVRLMAGGDVWWGTFKTDAAPGAGSKTIQVKSPTAITINYGPTAQLGNTITANPVSGIVRVTFSTGTNQSLFYQQGGIGGTLFDAMPGNFDSGSGNFDSSGGSGVGPVFLAVTR